MVKSMKELYEYYQKNPNFLLNYDDILLYYPDYYKTKVRLEKEKFPSKEETDKWFLENYKNSIFYNQLTFLALEEKEIYKAMKDNKERIYYYYKMLFDKLIDESISLCKLIDYIGHYPTTYPVPKEEEKDKEMEALLEKYDMIVRYHLDEDIMKIMSDDITRIIDKLEENLHLIDILKKDMKNNKWLLYKDIKKEEREKITNEFIEYIASFPLSSYQKQNKSRREEGKHYLRIQHGKDII